MFPVLVLSFVCSCNQHEPVAAFCSKNLKNCSEVCFAQVRWLGRKFHQRQSVENVVLDMAEKKRHPDAVVKNFEKNQGSRPTALNTTGSPVLQQRFMRCNLGQSEEGKKAALEERGQFYQGQWMASSRPREEERLQARVAGQSRMMKLKADCHPPKDLQAIVARSVQEAGELLRKEHMTKGDEWRLCFLESAINADQRERCLPQSADTSSPKICRCVGEQV